MCRRIPTIEIFILILTFNPLILVSFVFKHHLPCLGDVWKWFTFLKGKHFGQFEFQTNVSMTYYSIRHPGQVPRWLFFFLPGKHVQAQIFTGVWAPQQFFTGDDSNSGIFYRGWFKPCASWKLSDFSVRWFDWLVWRMTSFPARNISEIGFLPRK